MENPPKVPPRRKKTDDSSVMPTIPKVENSNKQPKNEIGQPSDKSVVCSKIKSPMDTYVSIRKPPKLPPTLKKVPLDSFIKVTQDETGREKTHACRDSEHRKEINTEEIVAEMKKELIVLKCNYIPDTLPRSFRQQFPGGKLKEQFQEIDLLLIGKTGNGKSALGNALLKKQAFLSSASLDSVTVDVTADSNEVNGVQLTVVDVPGISDTRKDEGKAIEDVLDYISKAMVLRPHGYHALLLVGKYGSRFTREESDTVTCLKKIFGRHFFSKFCIIVMTHGDQFEADSTVTFKDWVAQQKCEIFRDLMRECNNRIILFDNKTRDETKQENQLKILLKHIEILKMQNCRYSIDHFSTAQLSRDTLLVETNYDIYNDNTMQKASFIVGRYQKLLKTISPKERIPFLEELSNDAKELLETVTNLDKGTQILQSLIDHVKSLSNSIDDEIRMADKISQEKKKIIEKFEKEIYDWKQQTELEEKLISPLTTTDYDMMQQTLQNQLLENQAKMKSEYEEMHKRHEILRETLEQKLNVVHSAIMEVTKPRKDDTAKKSMFRKLKQKLSKKKVEKVEIEDHIYEEPA